MYQFIRVESYARSVKSGATASDIAKEAERHPDYVSHIIEAGYTPQPPTYVYGCTPSEAVEQAERWAAQAKDRTGRRLRSDAPVILCGVISYPRDGEEWFSFKRAAVRWLKQHYGDNLVSIVEHQDEENPHLHFYVVPSPGQTFDDLHPGRAASAEAKRAGKSKTYQLRAFADVMRDFQDRVYSELCRNFAMARIGPRRQRLKRFEWKAQQAALRAEVNAERAARAEISEKAKALEIDRLFAEDQERFLNNQERDLKERELAFQQSKSEFTKKAIQVDATLKENAAALTPDSLKKQIERASAIINAIDVSLIQDSELKQKILSERKKLSKSASYLSVDS